MDSEVVVEVVDPQEALRSRRKHEDEFRRIVLRALAENNPKLIAAIKEIITPRREEVRVRSWPFCPTESWISDHVSRNK